jgi:indole-3-glycerol phosphate synthase
VAFDFLRKVIVEKQGEVEEAKKRVPFDVIKARAKECLDRRRFKHAISRPRQINLIAEIKKASPSRGIIREDFNPVEIARTYESCHAAALSVLTESKYFHGSLLHLSEIKKAVSLPVLRKDFIIDPYQVCESAVWGADAILLIVAAIEYPMFVSLLKTAADLDLDVLTEVHSQDDVEKALSAGAEVIGINNRNLHTLKVDLKTTEELIRAIPPSKIIVSESGIRCNHDIVRLFNLGVHAVLIGEAFVSSQDIRAKVLEVMGR